MIVASSSPDRIDAALERLPTSAEGYTVNVRREEEIRDRLNRLGSFDRLAFTAGQTLQIGAIADTDLDVAASICGALDALTRALAVELAPLRVDAAGPGVVRSDLWRDMRAGPLGDVRLAPKALPVGRLGEVSDIAETFLYLMRNGYSSGTIVTVDGGSVLV